ncbi:MAG: hypothetical protein R6X15_07245 [Pseudomonadota bacterium]
MNKYQGCLVLICAAVIGYSQTAHAEELLELSGVGGKGFRAGSDPIHISMSQALSEQIRPYLHLEIDAIDVTEFIRREADSLIYTPMEPLQPGMHELRVVANLPDGSIEEVAVWTIEVRASRDFRLARFGSTGIVQAVNRVADDLQHAPQQRTQAQGAVALNGELADGNWHTSGEANLIYNSLSERNLSGEELELMDYRIRTDWSQAALTLGHQTVPANSLVLNEFNRRGISGVYRSDDERLRIGAFGMRTEETVGIEDITGLAEASQRTSGALATVSPFTRYPERLSLSLVYLDGQGSGDGVAEFGDEALSSGGTATGLIAESFTGDRLWRIRGEMAQTNFDFDGFNTGYGAESDEAYSLLVGYDTSSEMARGAGTHWSVNMLHQRVGPWFHSLGNTALAADRKTTQLMAAYQGSEFELNVAAARNEDNVDQIAVLPTTALSTHAFMLTYTPTPLAGGGLFSSPSFSLDLNRGETRRVRTPLDFAGDDVDYLNVESSLSAAFQGDDWYWALSHSRAFQEDRGVSQNDAETSSSGIEVEMDLNGYLGFNSAIQYANSRYTNLDLEHDSLLASLRLKINYPRNWHSNLAYTWNREESSDGAVDIHIQTVELMTQWAYLRATESRAGVSFLATGSYQEREETGVESDQYQVFLGVNVTWANNL